MSAEPVRPFYAAQAQAPDADRALAACLAKGPLPDDATLGFVYVGEAAARGLPDLVARLKRETPVADWVAAAGHGVLGPEGESAEGACVAIMAGRFGEDAVRPFAGYDPAAPDSFLDPYRPWFARQSMVTALVHADPRERNVPAIVEKLSQGAFLVGGLTAAAGYHAQLATAEAKGAGAVSGAFFGDGAPLAIGMTQGCSPIGPVHRVTEAVETVVISLDGRPAFEVLKDEAGELIARDPRRAAGYIHVALPIEGSETADYTVRNLMGLDERRGWIAVGETLEAGDKLMFVRRDPNAARQDMDRMLKGLAARLGGRAVRGGVYASCVARGAHMFGRANVEFEMIKSALGDFPLVGFSANGEICRDRLYAYTGVLTLFL